MYPKTERYTPLGELENSEDDQSGRHEDAWLARQHLLRKRWLSGGRVYLIILHILTLTLTVLLILAQLDRQFLKLHLLPSEYCMTSYQAIPR